MTHSSFTYIVTASDSLVDAWFIYDQNKVRFIFTCKTSIGDIKHELGFESISVLLPALVHLVQSVFVSIQSTL